jgi:hypothetical protein
MSKPQIVEKKIDWARKREEWLTALEKLCDSITAWCEAEGWSVQRDEKLITEDHIGQYTAPALLIHSPGGRIHIDPIGRNIIGAEGRVDILCSPSLNRLLLVRMEGSWKIKTEDRVDWPESWSKTAFLKIVRALQSAA